MQGKGKGKQVARSWEFVRNEAHGAGDLACDMAWEYECILNS